MNLSFSVIQGKNTGKNQITKQFLRLFLFFSHIFIIFYKKGILINHFERTKA